MTLTRHMLSTALRAVLPFTRDEDLPADRAGVRFSVEGPHLVLTATDGHTLARVVLLHEGHGVTGWNGAVPVHLLRRLEAAIRPRKKGERAQPLASFEVSRTRLAARPWFDEEVSLGMHGYVPIERVIPSRERAKAPTPYVGLDARYLARVGTAAALLHELHPDAGKKTPAAISLAIRQPEHELDAPRFDAYGVTYEATFVISPVRL